MHENFFFFRHALLLEETFLRLKTFHVSSKRALARKLFATPLKLDYSDIKEKENFWRSLFWKLEVIEENTGC